MKKAEKKNVTLVVGVSIVCVIALALVIAGISFAWYTTHSIVRTAELTLSSAEMDSSLSIVIAPPLEDPYKGQSGTDKEGNAVYTVSTVNTLTIHGDKPTYRFFVYPVKTVITRVDGEVFDSYTDSSVIPSFTWRATVGDRTYMPDPDGSIFAVDTLTGELLTMPEDGEEIQVVLTVIYLDETSYQKYLPAVTEEDFSKIFPFRYTDYACMAANFEFEYAIGFQHYDQENAEPEPQAEP